MITEIAIGRERGSECGCTAVPNQFIGIVHVIKQILQDRTSFDPFPLPLWLRDGISANFPILSFRPTYANGPLSMRRGYLGTHANARIHRGNLCTPNEPEPVEWDTAIPKQPMPVEWVGNTLPCSQSEGIITNGRLGFSKTPMQLAVGG